VTDRWSHWSRTLAQMLRRGAVRSLVLRVSSVTYSVLGLDRLYARVLVFGRDITKPAPPVRTQVELELRELGAAETAAHCRERGEPTEAEVRRRIGAGYRFMVSRSGSRIVGEMWLATGDVWLSKLERWLRLEPDDVYVYYASLVPDLRGRDLGTARARVLGERLHQEGYRRIVYTVAPHNRPARGLPAKLGAELLGTLGYVRIGRLRRNFTFLRGQARQWSDDEPRRTKVQRLPVTGARARRFEPPAELQREAKPRA